MKYQINSAAIPVDAEALQRALRAIDDSAQVAVDPLSGQLQVLAFLDDSEVVRFLASQGHAAESLRARDCCGSCS